MKTNRYTVINRGTVKNDRFLTVTVLPGCSPGLVPGSNTVSSQYRPVCPGFTTVKPSFNPVVYLGILVTAFHTTVMHLCLPELIMITTEVNQDTTGAICGTPCLSRYSPSGITVCPGIGTFFPIVLTYLPVCPGCI